MLLVALLLSSAARAVEPDTSQMLQSAPKVLADYLGDLGGDDAPERLYAARYVRGVLRTNLRAQAHAEPGGLADLEARSVLTELHARVPHACSSALRFKNSAVLCAEMLADLDRVDMLADVQASRGVVSEKCAVKRLEAAIERLEATAQSIPSPQVAPATTPAAGP